MTDRRLALDDGSLVDVLDRLLDTGAYVDGTVLLTLADVDLVRLDLKLLLASIHTLQTPGQAGASLAEDAPDAARAAVSAPPQRNSRPKATATQEAQQPAVHRPEPLQEPRVRTAAELSPTRPRSATPDSDQEEPRDDRPAGVAGLVVMVVDIVRQLLERQALRRMDDGTLTEQEVERLGRALMALEQQVQELTEFISGRRRHRRPTEGKKDTP